MFIERIKSYLEKWIETAGLEKEYEALRDLFIKEHTLNACPREWAAHLREQKDQSLHALADAAKHYLEAHNTKFAHKTQRAYVEERSDESSGGRDGASNQPICFACGSDMWRVFCRSCDICQRTISKGRIPKVPLHKMPLIDQPFKRVAVDLVGPISPPSEKGRQYILTLVDYTTRYPETIALKRINTPIVAEALVDMFSRLGIPEEILNDLGIQFVSECMEEVNRLLSVRHLTTTPYHPMCNGLVERFNGTLKAMLKKHAQSSQDSGTDS